MMSNIIATHRRYALFVSASIIIATQVLVAFVTASWAIADTFGTQTFITGAIAGVAIAVLLISLCALLLRNKLQTARFAPWVAALSIVVVASVATGLITAVRAAMCFFMYLEP